MNEKKTYIPDIPETLMNIGRQLQQKFPFLSTCLWSTSAFNEFMLHQPGRFFLLVEVEKEATRAVFYFLKERGLPVFLDPSQKILDLYLPDEKETWIIKPLVSEAPLQQVSQAIRTATLEKMLVDIFCDEVLFSAQQGSELSRIFVEATEKYIVNEDRLLRYAARRGRREHLIELLENISKKGK
jgi:hypothetical protein